MGFFKVQSAMKLVFLKAVPLSTTTSFFKISGSGLLPDFFA
jgi:hypothetical protein